MALRVFLKHPWYDPEGYYRRVEDNPHVVNLDVSKIPSTASIEDSSGKRELVWKLRGDPDPQTVAAETLAEQEALKQVPLARALLDPKGTLKTAAEKDREIEELKKENEALTKKLSVEPPKAPDTSPPIQQDFGAGVNATPGSNPASHGTQAIAEGEQSPGSSETVTTPPDQPSGAPKAPATTKK